MKKIFLSLLLFVTSVHAEIKNDILDKARKSTVSIEGRAAVAAYGNKGSWSGTGFMANLAKGIIVTNEHVSKASSAIASYFIKFHNGKIAPAKLAYYDLWQDFAFLQVDPKDIPQDVQEITFSSKAAYEGQHVFIVGNNEGQSFSFHDGYISNPFEINGHLAQHTFVMNLNTAGGSSGSPVLNEEGEAIAINFAGSKTYALAVHGSYVADALKSFVSNEPIQRKHIGIVVKLYSLDKAVKHKNFPEELMTSYLKEFPNTRNNVIAVKSFMPGSKAADKLQNGDIIWQVNGKKIGANLYEFDRLMNTAKQGSIDLVIYRNGQKISVTADLYDVESDKITRILEFGGSYLFESNDFTSYISGIPIRSLTTFYITPGGGLSTRDLLVYSYEKEDYRLKVTSIGPNPVSDIDSAVKAICALNNSKFITVGFENYSPFITLFNGIVISRRDSGIADVVLSNTEIMPKLYKFNSKIMEWELNNNPCKP